jgi:ABC-type multidrug transport system fused ATPase/permease subunit
MDFQGFLRRRHTLFAFLRLRWRAALWACLLDFVANCCLVAQSLLLAQAVALQFGFRSFRGSLLGLQHLGQGPLLGVLMAVILAKCLLDVARERGRGRLAEDFAHALRIRAFAQHLRADLQHHEGRDRGNSLLRFSGDLGGVQRLLSRGVLQFVADLGLLLLGLGLIAVFDPRLALLAAAWVLLAMGLGHLFNRRLRHIEARRRGKKSVLLASVNAALGQLASIQALNRSTRAEQDFGRKAERVRRLGHRYHHWAAWQAALPPFFAQTLLLLVLAGGSYTGLSGAALFAVVLVLMSWRSPLARLLRVGLVWKKGFLSLEKFDALLRAPQAADGAVVLQKKGPHHLRLHDVSLTLAGKTLLPTQHFELGMGQWHSVTLPTGGGKTTLTKLLAGLYAPTQGSIEWDGQPLAELNRQALRRQLAFVSDAFPLTGRTLLDALSPSGQAEALADTERAFRDFQALFPRVLGGVEARQKLEGRALLLSSGQQRLLQCLRAVLAKRPFWVLDDPFAGMDADTEEALRGFLIQNGIEKGVLLLCSEKSGK